MKKYKDNRAPGLREKAAAPLKWNRGKLLTVAVPAYNAQHYLGHCLTSMLRIPDPLRELLEIIVVDDGSVDQTGDLAEAYACRFPDTVCVIHKENGGHGSGINTGIDAAQGLYFKVIDADDWVDSAAFAELIRYLEEVTSAGNGTDLVVSGFYWVFDNGTAVQNSFWGQEPQKREKKHEETKTGGAAKTEELSGESTRLRRLKRKAEIREPFHGVRYREPYRFDEVADRLYVKMHGMTIRTDILRGHAIRLDEHCYYVDTEYMLYPVPYIDTVSFIPEFVYLYRLGRQGQSMSPERLMENHENFERVLRALLRFYKRCTVGEIPCSREKQRYLANTVARIAAGEVKILLSFPASREAQNRLIRFEQALKTGAPDIYHANRNKAVALLRKSGCRLYPAAVIALRLSRRIFGYR